MRVERTEEIMYFLTNEPTRIMMKTGLISFFVLN